MKFSQINLKITTCYYVGTYPGTTFDSHTISHRVCMLVVAFTKRNLCLRRIMNRDTHRY